MSRQSDAKEAQGYVATPVPSTCVNCTNFASDMVLPEWAQREVAKGAKHWSGSDSGYSVERDGVEKNRRCTLGGFAVKKMATCDKFAPKVAA